MSRVKVGLKIRPLLAKEKSSTNLFQDHNLSSQTSQVSLKGQHYAFDQVFGSDYSQKQFYEETAAPLLKGFLEGYNVTIMAYGQTGSGKTFTMGTSDNFNNDPSPSNAVANSNSCDEDFGLITRFVQDLFENMKENNENGSKEFRINKKVKVSFLEIYGEDVFDLIGFKGGSNGAHIDKPSLPVREDENGKVFVQGLNEVEVDSAFDALSLLATGSKNRVTAATAMNAGSSRSHAIYTISLEQHFKSSSFEEDKHHMTSKLTFVDLAGSERIKKTLADGQRMKEGIQINSGLFNLGQVINALADDQKLKQGIKTSHVPYRNSKLTHLLKDALGGNSQTWFIACVSPAECNEVETISTLTYAKQARNIQNKPVKNMDPVQVEIRRLKYMVKAWMSKAIHLKFGSPRNSLDAVDSLARDLFDQSISTDTDPSTPNHSSSNQRYSGKSNEIDFSLISEYSETLSPLPSASDSYKDALYDQPNVQEYIEKVNKAIEKNLQIATPAARKVRLSVGGNSNTTSISSSSSSSINLTPSKVSNSSSSSSSNSNSNGSYSNGKAGKIISNKKKIPSIETSAALDSSRDKSKSSAIKSLATKDRDEGISGNLNSSGLGGKPSLAIASQSILDFSYADELQNESQQLVGRMMELLNLDKAETEALMEVDISSFDDQISEKESILVKLMSNVNSFSKIQQDFEKLLDTISALEGEKVDLELELEKIKCQKVSGGGPNAAIERVKDRYLKIKDELTKMKEEKKNKETAYIHAQRESRVCQDLQKEIQKLKESKVEMMKLSKRQNIELLKIRKEQTTLEITNKKNDFKYQKQLDSLKNELVIKEKVLSWKDKELSRISIKLKACEEHISQLIIAQNKKQQQPQSQLHSVSTTSKQFQQHQLITTSNASNGVGALGLQVDLPASDLDYFSTTKGVLKNYLDEKLEKSSHLILYETIARQIYDLNSKILQENNRLESLRQACKGVEKKDKGKRNENMDKESNSSSSGSKESEIFILENQIADLGRELDVRVADLDLYLTSKIESSSTDKEEHSTGIISDLIMSLNLNQSQAMLVEYISEFISVSDKLVKTSEDYKRLNKALDMESNKTQLLESEIHDLKGKIKTQMKSDELKRINDMWEAMKSSKYSSYELKDAIDIAEVAGGGEIKLLDVDIADIVLDINMETDGTSSKSKQPKLLSEVINKMKQIEVENHKLSIQVAELSDDKNSFSASKRDFEEENQSLANKLLFFYQGNVYNNIFKEFSAEETSDLTLSLWKDSKSLIENIRLVGFEKCELQNRLGRSFLSLKTDVESMVSNRQERLQSLHRYYLRMSKILELKTDACTLGVKDPLGEEVDMKDIFNSDIDSEMCTSSKYSLTLKLEFAKAVASNLFKAYTSAKAKLSCLSSEVGLLTAQIKCIISDRSSLFDLLLLNKSGLIRDLDFKAQESLSAPDRDGSLSDQDIEEWIHLDTSLLLYLYDNHISLSESSIEVWTEELQSLRNIKIKKYESILEKGAIVASLMQQLNISDLKLFLKFFASDSENNKHYNFNSYISQQGDESNISSLLTVLSDCESRQLITVENADLNASGVSHLTAATDIDEQVVFNLFEQLVSFGLGKEMPHCLTTDKKNLFLCTVNSCCNAYLEVCMLYAIDLLEEIRSNRLRDIELVENLCMILSSIVPNLIQVLDHSISFDASEEVESILTFDLIELKESCISCHKISEIIRALINIIMKKIPNEVNLRKEAILAVVLDDSSEQSPSINNAVGVLSSLIDAFALKFLKENKGGDDDTCVSVRKGPTAANILTLMEAIDSLTSVYGNQIKNETEIETRNIVTQGAIALELHLSKVTPLTAVTNEQDLQAQMKRVFSSSCCSTSSQTLVGSAMAQLGRCLNENVELTVNALEVKEMLPIITIATLLEYLNVEYYRVSSTFEIVKELQKSDAHFLKQIRDMQLFEATSKTDRTRLLLGNSKALVEEERVRKSNKKKYETLAERISALSQQLVLNLSSNNNNNNNFGGDSNNSLQVTQEPKLSLAFLADMSFLSDHAQEVLNGKVRKEKIELLHLQSSFASTTGTSASNAAPNSNLASKLPTVSNSILGSKDFKEREREKDKELNENNSSKSNNTSNGSATVKKSL